MIVPPHVAEKIEAARQLRSGYEAGVVRLTVSSNATVEARDALMHWFMEIVHDRELAA